MTLVFTYGECIYIFPVSLRYKDLADVSVYQITKSTGRRLESRQIQKDKTHTHFRSYNDVCRHVVYSDNDNHRDAAVCVLFLCEPRLFG